MDPKNSRFEREYRQTKKMIEIFTMGRVDAAFLSLVVLVLLFAVIDTYLTFMSPVDQLHPFRFSPETWSASPSIRLLQIKYLGEVVLIILLFLARHLFPKKLMLYQRFTFSALLLLFALVIILERFIFTPVG